MAAKLAKLRAELGTHLHFGHVMVAVNLAAGGFPGIELAQLPLIRDLQQPLAISRGGVRRPGRHCNPSKKMEAALFSLQQLPVVAPGYSVQGLGFRGLSF